MTESSIRTFGSYFFQVVRNTRVLSSFFVGRFNYFVTDLLTCYCRAITFSPLCYFVWVVGVAIEMIFMRTLGRPRLGGRS